MCQHVPPSHLVCITIVNNSAVGFNRLNAPHLWKKLTYRIGQRNLPLLYKLHENYAGEYLCHAGYVEWGCGIYSHACFIDRPKSLPIHHLSINSNRNRYSRNSAGTGKISD